MIVGTFTGTSGDNRSGSTHINLAVEIPSDLRPDGELQETLSLFSDATDAQREETEKRILGLVVDWQLPVYDVSRRSDDEYVVQTSGGNQVGTFCHIRTLSDADRAYLLTLKTNSIIRCKGVIKGIFLRYVVIDPAVLLAR
jgi:hypothetical protein